eukprot:scaffold14613_cov59-Phaeocystis_antarctica.AAC.3
MWLRTLKALSRPRRNLTTSPQTYHEGASRTGGAARAPAAGARERAHMHALLAAVAVLGLHPAPAFRHPHSVFQPAAAWRTATERTATVRTATVRACAVEEAGIRVNKALRATHSRREADRLIDAGRVTVNAVAATSGDRLVRGDAVCLDGSPVDWERLNPPPAAAAATDGGGGGGGSRFIYLKYWKPRGVVCTTDRRQRGNILDELGPLPGVTDPNPSPGPNREPSPSPPP